MAANRYYIPGLLIVGLLITRLAMANDDVISILNQAVALSMVQAEQKAAECLDKKKRRLDYITDKTLKAHGLSRAQAVAAIGYLSLRNDYACSHESMLELSYALSMLENAHKAYKYESMDLQEIQAELLLPNTRYFELEVEYRKIPWEARSYLDKVVGDEPFDLISTLDAIPVY